MFRDAYYLDTLPFSNTMFGKNERMSDEDGREKRDRKRRGMEDRKITICY